MERVYYIKDTEGSIHCVFLDQLVAYDINYINVTTYTRIGQHGEATLEWINEQRPAREFEYRHLHKEISSIYGIVNIIQAILAKPVFDEEEFRYWDKLSPTELDAYLLRTDLPLEPKVITDEVPKDPQYPTYQVWVESEPKMILLPVAKNPNGWNMEE